MVRRMVFLKERMDKYMNAKDLFEGIELLKKECERSENALVLNIWHSGSDLMMTTLCGKDEDIAFAILTILFNAEKEVAEKAIRYYQQIEKVIDILKPEN